MFTALSLLIIGLAQCTTAIIDEGTTGPITKEVTYSDASEVMFKYCLTCHGSVTPSAGLSLHTYENLRFATEKGNLISRINSQTNPMPQNGLMPLEERQIIQKWADDGFPQ